MQQFKAIQNFFSEETKSEYVEGLYYTAQSEPLLTLINTWASQGKIELTESGVSTISGRG